MSKSNIFWNFFISDYYHISRLEWWCACHDCNGFLLGGDEEKKTFACLWKRISALWM